MTAYRDELEPAALLAEIRKLREEIRAIKGRLQELEDRPPPYQRPDPFRPIGPGPGKPPWTVPTRRWPVTH